MKRNETHKGASHLVRSKKARGWLVYSPSSLFQVDDWQETSKMGTTFIRTTTLHIEHSIEKRVYPPQYVKPILIITAMKSCFTCSKLSDMTDCSKPTEEIRELPTPRSRISHLTEGLHQ